MRPRHPSIACVLAVALAMPALGQAQSRTLASADEARQAAVAIVASLGANNVAAALKELKPLTVVPAAEFDVFEAQLNSQMGQLMQRYGAPSGHELVKEERLGERLVRYQLLVFHEKAPIRWTFVFYRAAAGWWITDFKFDGNAMTYFGG